MTASPRVVFVRVSAFCPRCFCFVPIELCAKKMEKKVTNSRWSWTARGRARRHRLPATRATGTKWLLRESRPDDDGPCRAHEAMKQARATPTTASHATHAFRWNPKTAARIWPHPGATRVKDGCHDTTRRRRHHLSSSVLTPPWTRGAPSNCSGQPRLLSSSFSPFLAFNRRARHGEPSLAYSKKRRAGPFPLQLYPRFVL
jgi:hypothetical protein